MCAWTIMALQIFLSCNYLKEVILSDHFLTQSRAAPCGITAGEENKISIRLPSSTCTANKLIFILMSWILNIMWKWLTMFTHKFCQNVWKSWCSKMSKWPSFWQSPYLKILFITQGKYCEWHTTGQLKYFSKCIKIDGLQASTPRLRMVVMDSFQVQRTCRLHASVYFYLGQWLFLSLPLLLILHVFVSAQLSKHLQRRMLCKIYIDICCRWQYLTTMLNQDLQNKIWDFLNCSPSKVSWWMGIKYFEWWIPATPWLKYWMPIHCDIIEDGQNKIFTFNSHS